MRDDRAVLAALERELDADPVLAALRSRLHGGTRTPPASRAPRTLLTVGLVIQLVGCLVLSVPLAVVGFVSALYPLVVLAASVWRSRRT